MKRKMLVVTITVMLLLVAFATPALAHDGVGGDELAAADAMLQVAMVFFVLTGLGIIWAVRNGEFRDPEGTKYDMLNTALVDDDGQDLEKYVTIEVQ